MNDSPYMSNAHGWRGRCAFVHDLLYSGGRPYLERWYIELLGYTLRLHKFHACDPDRARHDHPWWFITFPLRAYYEVRGYGRKARRYPPQVHRVAPFRFHFRPATFRHRIVSIDSRGAYTIVLTGRRARPWGFWPTLNQFVPWRSYR